MTKRSKRDEKIIKGMQKSYRFSEIKIFLENFGFKTEKKGTSHYIFRKEPYPHITIVVHVNQVKHFYVKRAIQILKEYEILT